MSIGLAGPQIEYRKWRRWNRPHLPVEQLKAAENRLGAWVDWEAHVIRHFEIPVADESFEAGWPDDERRGLLACVTKIRRGRTRFEWRMAVAELEEQLSYLRAFGGLQFDDDEVEMIAAMFAEAFTAAT